MQWFIIIALVFLFIFFFPLIIDVKMVFNVVDNSGTILVQLFNITVLSGKLRMHNAEIILSREEFMTKKKKDVVYKINELIMSIRLSKYMSEKIEFKKISLAAIYSNVDPMQACLIKSAIESIFLQVLSIIVTKSNLSKAEECCFVGFGEEKLVFTAKLRVWISIWDAILAFIISKIQSNKQKKLLKGEKNEAV